MSLKSIGRTHWDGDLITGSGETSFDSGAAGPLAITWKARSEDHGGLTSPEELIASAHASCFAMSLASTLAKADTPPTSLDTQATVTFVPGTGITEVELSVVGNVPGVDESAFLEAVNTAKDNCPVSRALKGNVEVSVSGSLV
ncbi:MAG TPA: OsmC family peroxiredoxin [Acidimicrobiia bacterium]|jgi:osmotically inducible protein OsmC